MKRPVLLAVLMLAATATAQMRMAPMASPVAPAPAQMASQALQRQSSQASGNEDASAGGALNSALPAAPPVDPRTTGAQLAGKDLKKAIKTVTALKWQEKLVDAKAEAMATGKPILWIQALGELDGFA